MIDMIIENRIAEADFRPSLKKQQHPYLHKGLYPPAKLPIGINVGHFEETASVISQNPSTLVNTIDTTMLNRWGTPLFPVIRFMDWQKINRLTRPNGEPTAPYVNWNDLPQSYQPWDYTSGPWIDFRGVPLRLCVEVANLCQASPWICLHHTGNDGYINHVIDYVIANANHRPIFEFSNEVWNGAFRQYHDCADRGLAEGLSTDPLLAALYWQAKRTAFMIDRVGDDGSVVLSSQAGNPWVTEQLLDYLYNQLNRRVDALAIAPYFGHGVTVGSSTSVSELADMLRDEITGPLREKCEEHAALCAQYDVPLWGYEGGQHLFARNSNSAEANLFFGLNRSPHIKVLMKEWLTMWYEIGGELICPYSLVSRYETEYWGMLNGADDHYLESSKFHALLDAMGLPFHQSWSE